MLRDISDTDKNVDEAQELDKHTSNKIKLGQGTAHINLHQKANTSGTNTFEFRLEDSNQPGKLPKVDDTFSFCLIAGGWC